MEDWCKKNNCEHYIEWSYYVDEDVGEVPCISCKLQGQSHRIEEIPENCPHRHKDLVYDMQEANKNNTCDKEDK